MLEGKIEAIVKDDRGCLGLMLCIWVPCANTKFIDDTMKTETDEQVKKRKNEWEHLHYGTVQINQSD